MSMIETRHTSRLIILDPDDRILLIKYVARKLPDASHDQPLSFWFTPGGGIEPGESAEEAALREMDEEVGLTGLPLLGEVARRSALNDQFERVAFCHERYFLVRAASAVFNTARLAETDQDEVLDVRWWSLDGFERSGHVLIPPAVLALTRLVMNSGVPAHPLDLLTMQG